MVEFQDIQTAYYIIAAVGIFVASANYLRVSIEDSKKRRIETTNNMMQTLISKDGLRSWLELLNMEWSDYDDFERKYGTDYNFESAITRLHMWYTYDILGYQLMKGLVDEETIYDAYGSLAIWIWDKFKPILDEHRRKYSPKEQWRGWEYLANSMLKVRKRRDPEYVTPKTYTKYIPDK
jgi:hypothetical protein